MINPACELCKGACCEGITITLDAAAISADARLHWQLHGDQWDEETTFLPCACRRLKDGYCTTYSNRPQGCVELRVGSPQCRQAVRKLRPKNWSSIYRLMENQ